MAASATFALKPGVWFRRGRLLMVSPDKMGTACPLSDRNSTYRPVQISGTGSVGASGRRERVLENDGPLWLPNSPFGNLAVRLGRPAHARATATRAASSNAFTWNEYANSDFVGPMHSNGE